MSLNTLVQKRKKVFVWGTDSANWFTSEGSYNYPHSHSQPPSISFVESTFKTQRAYTLARKPTVPPTIQCPHHRGRERVPGPTSGWPREHADYCTLYPAASNIFPSLEKKKHKKKTQGVVYNLRNFLLWLPSCIEAQLMQLSIDFILIVSLTTLFRSFRSSCRTWVSDQ